MNKPFFLLSIVFALLPASLAEAGSVFVKVQTNLGAFTLELDSGKAPKTVANFLAYLSEGFYKDTVFHRSPKNFVVQGGGFDLQLTQKATHDPIALESTNITGLSNLRGTVAMARTDVFDSATSQFYINVANNTFLDYVSPATPQYAVFGKVVEGMETVDAINALPVYTVSAQNGVQLTNFPNLNSQTLDPVYIQAIAPLEPLANAGQDFSVDSGVAAALDGSGSSDPTPGQSQPLGYRWTQIAGPKVQFTGDANAAKPGFIAPVVAANTVLTFQLVVTNAYGNSSTNTAVVNVTVKARNNPPVADPGPGGTIRAGATLILDGGASYDPDNDPIASYAWAAPEGIALTGADTAKPSLAVPLATLGQSLVFSLTVSDGVLFDTKTAIYAVVDNSPPVVKIDPQTIRENSRITLNAAVSDPDGDGLSYFWRQTDGTPVFLDKTDGPSLSFTAPGGAGSEELQFSLTVTDDYAANPKSTTDTTKVMVNDDPNLLDCSRAFPSRESLWPANKGLAAVAIQGITPPNAYDLAITGVASDEPVRDKAAKDTTGPDAKIRKGKATRNHPRRIDSVLLRAERQLKQKSGAGSGNGRVYTVNFSAADGARNCTGSVKVAVPPLRGQTAVDDGQKYDATQRR